MTRLFRRQSRQWCVDAVNFIEEGLASGLQSSSTVGQGGVAYSSLDDALYKISQLNARIDEIDAENGMAVSTENDFKILKLFGKSAW